MDKEINMEVNGLKEKYIEIKDRLRIER